MLTSYGIASRVLWHCINAATEFIQCVWHLVP